MPTGACSLDLFLAGPFSMDSSAWIPEHPRIQVQKTEKPKKKIKLIMSLTNNTFKFLFILLIVILNCFSQMSDYLNKITYDKGNMIGCFLW